MAAAQPGVAPEEVAAGLGAQHPPVGLLEQPVHLAVADVGANGLAAGGVDGLAHLIDPGQGLLLAGELTHWVKPEP